MKRMEEWKKEAYTGVYTKGFEEGWKRYKKKVQDALNKLLKHNLVYRGIIQVFPNAIYHVDGIDILELYKELEIENKAR